MINWKPHIDKPEDFGATRAESRIALALIAIIDDRAGHQVKMRVRNISASGCGGVVELPHKLKPDLAVSVKFGSYPEIDALVVRANRENVGLRFEDVVDVDMIRQARANPAPKFELNDMHKVVTPKWMIERAKHGL
jgi:hypothetical protein